VSCDTLVSPPSGGSGGIIQNVSRPVQMIVEQPAQITTFDIILTTIDNFLSGKFWILPISFIIFVFGIVLVGLGLVSKNELGYMLSIFVFMFLELPILAFKMKDWGF